MMRLVIMFLLFICAFTVSSPYTLAVGSSNPSYHQTDKFIVQNNKSSQSDSQTVCTGTNPTAEIYKLGYQYYGDNSWSLGASPRSNETFTFAVNNVTIGDNMVFINGTTGSFNFSAVNEPNFCIIAKLLTNGQDDEITLRGTGGAIIMKESTWLSGKPDLVGHKGTIIRLVVQSCSFYSTEDGASNEISTMWEIWGYPPRLAKYPGFTFTMVFLVIALSILAIRYHNQRAKELIET